jgi:hypothetical protein
MSLNAVVPDYEWQVKVTWSKLEGYDRLLGSGSSADSDAWLYMILGFHLNSPPKLFYIGMVFEKEVSRRLRESDHRKRRIKIQCDYPRHQLRVSLGKVDMESGCRTYKRIDEIETLLIFAHSHSHKLHIANKRKLLTHRITEHYTIRNCGYRKPLFREIQFGMFAK